MLRRYFFSKSCDRGFSVYRAQFCEITVKKRKPPGYWSNIDNQRAFLDELANKLDITEPSQWKKIKLSTIRQNGGSSFVGKYNNIKQLFQTIYPEQEWDPIFPSETNQTRGNQSNSAPLDINLQPKPTPLGEGKQKAPGKSLMLSQVWNESIDPTGYWISEKYDGIRAFWSGSVLASRYGRILPAPEWFKEKLPKDFPIDGELWAGEGNFGHLIKILRSSSDEHWQKCKLMAFDSPDENLAFEERIEKLHNSVTENDHLQFVPFQKCRGREHLKEVLQEVVDRNGEGLMLRQSGAGYEIGRSYSMLKVKIQQDAEVRMIRKASKCKGFDAELPNGVVITIRCTYSDYKYPPPAGAVLKVKHFGEWENSGKLKNAYFLRVRNDGVTWDDIVTQYKLDRGLDIDDVDKE